MARGWESRAVEEQMEEAQRAAPAGNQAAASGRELELRQRRETLLLGRSHLIGQLSRARSDVHRRMLEQSLAEIERQLAELDQLLSTGG